METYFHNYIPEFDLASSFIIYIIILQKYFFFSFNFYGINSVEYDKKLCKVIKSLSGVLNFSVCNTGIIQLIKFTNEIFTQVF